MAKNKVKDLFDKLEAEVAPQAAKARVMKRNGDESYTAADIEVLPSNAEAARFAALALRPDLDPARLVAR